MQESKDTEPPTTDTATTKPDDSATTSADIDTDINNTRKPLSASISKIKKDVLNEIINI